MKTIRFCFCKPNDYAKAILRMKVAMPETEKQEYEPKLGSLAASTYCYHEMSKCCVLVSSILPPKQHKNLKQFSYKIGQVQAEI